MGFQIKFVSTTIRTYTFLNINIYYTAYALQYVIHTFYKLRSGTISGALHLKLDVIDEVIIRLY